jgi:hypothetical protein
MLAQAGNDTLVRSLHLLPGLRDLAVELLVGRQFGDWLAVHFAFVGQLDVVALLRGPVGGLEVRPLGAQALDDVLNLGVGRLRGRDFRREVVVLGSSKSGRTSSVIVTLAGAPVAMSPSSIFTMFNTSSFSFSNALRYALATTFCLKSSTISLLKRFATIAAGALPGRKPGMRATFTISPTTA